LWGESLVSEQELYGQYLLLINDAEIAISRQHFFTSLLQEGTQNHRIDSGQTHAVATLSGASSDLDGNWDNFDAIGFYHEINPLLSLVAVAASVKVDQDFVDGQCRNNQGVQAIYEFLPDFQCPWMIVGVCNKKPVSAPRSIGRASHL